MNFRDIHSNEKDLETKILFTPNDGKAIAIRLAAQAILKEHITTVPAFLICISGETLYEDEQGKSILLKNGDFTPIEPNVKHWLKATAESHLILLK